MQKHNLLLLAILILVGCNSSEAPNPSADSNTQSETAQTKGHSLESQLVGLWHEADVLLDGKFHEWPAGTKVYLTIDEGNRYEYWAESTDKSDKQILGKGQFKHTLSADPHWVDYDFGDQRIKGIFRLHDGSLQVCTGVNFVADDERPSDFSASSGTKQCLFTFKRPSK